VRINSDTLPFHGQVGPVLKVDGAGVHVQVQMFGRAVPLVLAEPHLELVSPAPAPAKSERSAA
jgi:transcription antitermination factor NusG